MTLLLKNSTWRALLTIIRVLKYAVFLFPLGRFCM